MRQKTVKTAMRQKEGNGRSLQRKSVSMSPNSSHACYMEVGGGRKERRKKKKKAGGQASSNSASSCPGSERQKRQAPASSDMKIVQAGIIMVMGQSVACVQSPPDPPLPYSHSQPPVQHPSIVSLYLQFSSSERTEELSGCVVPYACLEGTRRLFRGKRKAILKKKYKLAAVM